MTHALFKQIDLTAKLGQDGSSLQAMNALRVIRETVAKHLVGAEAAEEYPLERALLALRTIAEFPCPEQDNMPAANMRQIALAALDGAGASSEPGNPGGEPVSGPGNAGERPHPAPGSGDSELAESLQTLERWLDRVAIEDGYVGVPVIEAVEVAVNELRRLQAEVADWQEAAGRSRSDVMAYIAERAKLLEEHDVALAEVGALKAELQSQRERNTELIFKLGSATNGWGRCEKERDAALARVAEYEAQAQNSVPEEFIGRLSEFLAQRGATGKALLRELRAMLAAEPTSSASPSCKWTESSGIWETGCGQTWGFVEDGPAENGALFCHHCGGRLVLIRSDDQEDDGEPCPECMEHGCNGECAGHGAMGD
ncbi:TPA: hypothetical protein M5Q67_005438 [Pseudomonas aeruginosa]|uniref:hypothetical protein n=1 Tax=Pseudomonas aeruginosa TaxID=287 RepID=UPI00071BDC7D|nr:hypothetical protein [Pseudomonas aeruginosa]KSJ59753.1 hypothetical protein AO997_17340 [Pseudomonas aeruginosa]HBN9494579.1 hypothetical protein [Pseudomonas aeruginosa]HCC4914439.1 hypothetical protein [Pseudomonas aeruginosa]